MEQYITEHYDEHGHTYASEINDCNVVRTVRAFIFVRVAPCFEVHNSTRTLSGLPERGRG